MADHSSTATDTPDNWDLAGFHVALVSAGYDDDFCPFDLKGEAVQDDGHLAMDRFKASHRTHTWNSSADT
jgi:hypothetical protein